MRVSTWVEGALRLSCLSQFWNPTTETDHMTERTCDRGGPIRLGHDLTNVIASVRGYAELGLKSDSLENMRRYFSRILSSAEGICASSTAQSERDSRILLIEDDATLAELLVEALQEYGYSVTATESGRAALREWRTQEPFDVVVLDLALSDTSGLEVLREIFKTDAVPVLILSAVEDVTSGLDAGADDYLIKPIALPELDSRIRALMRRRSRARDGLLILAGLELNELDRTVSAEDGSVHLTSREFEVLRLLMRAQGRVVSRGELLLRVWRMAFEPGTTVLDMAVHRLRKKLRKVGASAVLQARRGEGFQIVSRAARRRAGVLFPE